MIEIAVTGGRRFGMLRLRNSDRWIIDSSVERRGRRALDALWAQAVKDIGNADQGVAQANGKCSFGGFDLLAERWARFNSIEVIPYYADWKQYRGAAGPIRNQLMVDHASALIAAPGGKGTEDCVARAERKGIRIYLIDLSRSGGIEP